jgi:hypothetical protein
MISHLNYIIRFSIAKLFSAKFRLGSIAKVFALSGKDLSMNKEIIGKTEEDRRKLSSIKIQWYLQQSTSNF